MILPLYVLLIPYAIAIIIYLAWSLGLLYHIFKFGYWDSSTRLMLFLYFTGSLVILVSTGIYLVSVDWTQSISVFENIEFNISFF